MGRVGFEPLSEFRASWEMPHIVFHLLGMVLCMIGSEGSVLLQLFRVLPDGRHGLSINVTACDFLKA